MKYFMKRRKGEEGSEDDTTSEKRDRCKTRKLETMLGKGQVPTHIIDMLEQGSKDQANPRAFKTELINQLFNRDAKGKLTMQPHAPFFEAWKATSHTNRVTESEKALPKTVFCGKYFQNSEQALAHALAIGEVDKVEVNGK